MEGYSDPANRISEGVHDRLYARAFALAGADSRLVLVSCDACSLPLADYFKRTILERHALRSQDVFLCAIHTHSGPLLTLNPNYRSNVDYTRLLEGALVEVVGRALRALAPVRLRVGRGRSDVGVSRRTILPDGRVEMAPNREGPSDPEVLVLTLSRPGSGPFAAFFSYACHSRSLGPSNRLLSGDVLGVAEQFVEGESPGLICGAFAAASGDIDPVSVVDDFGARPAERPETLRLASLLGGEVARAMKDTRELATRAPRSATKRISVPSKHPGPAKSVTASVAAIGDLAIAGWDCEASVEAGLQLKARSPFGTTCVITNCNGWAGYMPVAHQYEEGGYEVDKTGFARDAAEIVVSETTRMLAALKADG
jgi:hypothetical protein